MSSSYRTSVFTKCTSAPGSRSSFSSFLPSWSLRPETTTRAPSRAKATAVARPIPVSAPVIKTTGELIAEPPWIHGHASQAWRSATSSSYSGFAGRGRQSRKFFASVGDTGDPPAAFRSLGQEYPRALHLRWITADLGQNRARIFHELLLTVSRQRPRRSDDLHGQFAAFSITFTTSLGWERKATWLDA